MAYFSKNLFKQTSSCSTVVEHPSHNPKIKGLNLATDIGGEKNVSLKKNLGSRSKFFPTSINKKFQAQAVKLFFTLAL